MNEDHRLRNPVLEDINGPSLLSVAAKHTAVAYFMIFFVYTVYSSTCIRHIRKYWKRLVEHGGITYEFCEVVQAAC